MSIKTYAWPASDNILQWDTSCNAFHSAPGERVFHRSTPKCAGILIARTEKTVTILWSTPPQVPMFDDAEQFAGWTDAT